MPRAIIFTGIPASGKSSYYHEHFPDCEHINLDTLRTRHREAQCLAACIREGRDFVADNTNPTPGDRERYIRPALAAGYEVIGYYFSSPIAACMERNRRRSGTARIPDQGVAAIYNRLCIPALSEGFHRLYFVRLTPAGFVTEEWREDA